VSTAISLSTRHPKSQITLIEAAPTIPNPHGSSVDSSRIVRADYANPAYAKLAAAGIQRWRTTDWGQEGRYTENGIVLVYPSDSPVAEQYTRASYENVKALEGEGKVGFLPTKAAVERVIPRYAAGSNIAGGYVNWGSGWANAEAGVRFARKKLEQMGKVTFKTGEVDRLLFADAESQTSQRKVAGVALTDGTSIAADLIILATGAWTPKLVDLRGMAEATGQVVAFLKLTDEEQQQLAHMPTILNFATGMFIIPPRNNELKIARHAYGYRNPKVVSVPGVVRDGEPRTIEISVPENGVRIPLEGEEACRNALREMLPEMADRPFSRTRVCWYTDTWVNPKAKKVVHVTAS
jgi:sarcosine oxidase/L-pipecolate oxidase